MIFQSPSRRGDRRFDATGGRTVAMPTFQSPSRRGDRRFDSPKYPSCGSTPAFQSPSRRGDRRFETSLGGFFTSDDISIPFTSGRSSVHRRSHLVAQVLDHFNPLHVGAIVGSADGAIFGRRRAHFNPLHV